MSTSSGRGASLSSTVSSRAPLMAPHHKLYLLFFAGLVVIFTFTSFIFQTHAYNVLFLQSAHPDLEPVASVFARKSNPINRIFIKKAWLWTTLADLALVFTLRSPTSSPNEASSYSGKGKQRELADADDVNESSSTAEVVEARREDQEATIASPVAKSLLRWFLATLCWLFFAIWLFGPPIMQRILTSSGGICVPHDGFPSSLSADPSSFRLPETRIDDAFCRAGSRGISKEERPELFRTAHAIVSDRIAGGKLRGAWRGGHDTSGHVFILILSSLLLLEELTPYLGYFAQATLPPSLSVRVAGALPLSLRANRNPYQGRRRRASLIATSLTLGLVGLWTFSLINTSLFFHTPTEKVSGTLIAFASWVVLPKGG